MVFFGKRGQAAMEFLVTYGWAFLVVLVMVGALAYFGVLNPQNLVSDRCIAPPGFSCEDYQVSATSGVTVKLKNGLGFTMYVMNGIANNYVTSPRGYNSACNPATDTSLDGGYINIYCPTNANSMGVSAGEKVKLDLSFKYYKRDSGVSFNKPAKIQIVSTVQ